jgi:hypothetical protein
MSQVMQRRLASLVDAMRQNCAGAGLDMEDVLRAASLDEMALRDDAPSHLRRQL